MEKTKIYRVRGFLVMNPNRMYTVRNIVRNTDLNFADVQEIIREHLQKTETKTESFTKYGQYVFSTVNGK
jgi:hypothetical protein